MRVLLATDGSRSSDIAAELTADIRWPSGTSLDVVRVVGRGGGDPVGGPWAGVGLHVSPDIHPAAIQDAEDGLAALGARFRSLGLRVCHAVPRGDPADELLGWIDRHRPDLVLVGNRGVSVLQRTLLGSVSAAVVDRSPVPVLVARRPALARVVIAVDGSDIASEAVATARRWPFLAMTEIRTVSIGPTSAVRRTADTGGGRSDGDVDHLAIAAEAAALLRAAGFTAEPDVRAGSPASTIVDFARDWDADLVILGSHGRTGLARLLLGSVARNVLHHATCSVLIIRRHAEPVPGRRVEIEARSGVIAAPA